MGEPRRLLEGGGSEFERMLLAAGRRERPSRTARWRNAWMLSLAGVGIVSRAGLAEATSVTGKAWVVGKWLAIGAVASTGTWGAVHYAASRGTTERAAPSTTTVLAEKRLASSPVAPDQVESPAEAAEMRPIVANSAARELPVPAASMKERPAGRLAARSSAETASDANGSLADQIRTIDQAQSALANSNAKGALSLVDRYDRQHPRGALQQEASLVRIEALFAQGDRATARWLAKRFLAANPKSAHVKRLQSLLDER